MADSILSKLTLADVERELAARRREVSALAKIRAALKRKATFDDVDRRLQERHRQREGSAS